MKPWEGGDPPIFRMADGIVYHSSDEKETKMALTAVTIEVDSDGMLTGEWPGATNLFLARRDSDGSRHRAKLPKGTYECKLDEKGVIVEMTPGLTIVCESYIDPKDPDKVKFPNCHYVGLNWVCT